MPELQETKRDAALARCRRLKCSCECNQQQLNAAIAADNYEEADVLQSDLQVETMEADRLQQEWQFAQDEPAADVGSTEKDLPSGTTPSLDAITNSNNTTATLGTTAADELGEQAKLLSDTAVASALGSEHADTAATTGTTNQVDVQQDSDTSSDHVAHSASTELVHHNLHNAEQGSHQQAADREPQAITVNQAATGALAGESSTELQVQSKCETTAEEECL